MNVASGNPHARPSWTVSALVSAALVAAWGCVQLVAYRDRVIPLTYVLPLLVCVWTARRSLLWLMAATFAIMLAVKATWFLPGDHEDHWLIFIAMMFNITVGTAVVHLIINLRQRLEAHAHRVEQSNDELRAANEELAAREEEISHQNEELQNQAEELSQQNEEVQRQSEELEAQSEDLQAANEALERRERMLQVLLEAARTQAPEQEIMRRVCESALTLFGSGVAGAAVLEAQGDQVGIVAHVGLGGNQFARPNWPLQQSLASLVMQQDRTGFIEDIRHRPDLIIPEPPGRPFRSLLASPLRLHGANVGAVEVYSYDPRLWTDEQFRLAEWLAAQCSRMLEMLRLHASLSRSEQRFRSLFQSISEGFAVHEIICDADGRPCDYRFLELNPAFERLTGLKVQTTVGRTVRQVIPGIEPIWIERFGQVALDGRPQRFEQYSAALDRHYEVFAFSPQPRQFAALFVDVTDRKLAEKAAHEARQAAEAANKAKDDFLAVLSHELRTPLAPVLLSVSLLERDASLSPAVREDLGGIRRNVELEARIIDDLLDLTRIAHGRLQFHFQPTDLHQLAKAALDICGRGEGAPIQLDLRATSSIVSADPARMQQVLWNLLSNARKFTPATGSIILRTVDGAGAGAGAGPGAGNGAGRVRLEVIDSGAGLETEFLTRMFSAFEQGEAGRSRQFGGLGLGLAICKAIVTAHEGDIRAHSDGRGRGATFIVELPLCPAPALAAPAEMLPPAAARGGDGHAPSILLVEDHPDTARVMGRVLQSHGFVVQTADTVAGALDLLQRERFHLLISDLGLPDGSGLDIIRTLRTGGSSLPAIALSGYGMEEDLRRSREAGFDHHLTKPVNLGQLHEAIAGLLQRP